MTRISLQKPWTSLEFRWLWLGGCIMLIYSYVWCTSSTQQCFFLHIARYLVPNAAWDCFWKQTRSYLQPAVAIAQVVASGISTDSGEKGATVEEHCGSWLKESQQNNVTQCGRSSYMCVSLSKCCGYHQSRNIFIAFFFWQNIYNIYITTLHNDKETVRYLPQG